MIVRIMGEGQFDISDVDQEKLQSFDNQVEKAVNDKDDAGTKDALAALHDFVRANGSPVADDFLGSSDFVIPYVDATLDEIAELLTGEGFIPDPA